MEDKKCNHPLKKMDDQQECERLWKEQWERWVHAGLVKNGVRHIQTVGYVVRMVKP